MLKQMLCKEKHTLVQVHVQFNFGVLYLKSRDISHLPNQVQESKVWLLQMSTTVKHGYREHAYNELTLTAKWFWFLETLLQVVNLSDITNYTYNEVPGTLL